MLKSFKESFQKDVYELFVGDYFAVQKKEVYLSTVLGPCIAVCLADKINGVAGMNHFMLPGWSERGDTRYGLNAMDLLIDEMVKNGAVTRNLTAKIFGGAEFFGKNCTNIAGANISFISSYLAERCIPVEKSDLGDTCGRRINYCTATYNVHVRKLGVDV